MSIVLEASLLLAAYLTVALLAYWLLLHKFHKAPAPPGEGRAAVGLPSHGLIGPVSGRRGSSTPLLCKTCRRNPWNRGPELLCSSCAERYWETLDEFARGQMDGAW